ncbi:MAG: potassium channel family protein [Duncaniella sp.]|nr:potassium channel family protein [Duncaniella sp.]
MNQYISNRLLHFWHVVSNVRPIYWITLYVAVVPVFAIIYWALPDGQFRIPDGATTDYGSWLYYSIVTITTLGFGDYTPAHGWAQGVTAVEVMCGLIFLGLFLNAVGSMKSEIDVTSEVERRRLLYEAEQKQKLGRLAPRIINMLNVFLAYCYAVTTPAAKRDKDGAGQYNPDFSFSDLSDMFKPSGLEMDNSSLPAVERMLTAARNASLLLDSAQNSVDMRQWPQLLEDSFSFVAEVQMLSLTDSLTRSLPVDTEGAPSKAAAERESTLAAKIAAWKGGSDFSSESELKPVGELYNFIRRNASLALDIEKQLSSIND